MRAEESSITKPLPAAKEMTTKFGLTFRYAWVLMTSTTTASQVPSSSRESISGTLLTGGRWFTPSIWPMTSSYMVSFWPSTLAPEKSWMDLAFS